MARVLKTAELFAGIGGVTGGLLDVGGFRSVLLHDCDELARDVFVHNFPDLADEYRTGCVSQLRGTEILDAAGGALDGLLGCPPCQGLSPVGTRDDDDERNFLLRHFLRLLRSTRPRFFLMENVPHLLRTALYRDFAEEAGRSYAIASGVLNAAEYGLPQLRCRAVVFGIRRSIGIKATLPTPTHGGTGDVFDYVRGSIMPATDPETRRTLRLGPSREEATLPFVVLENALDDLPSLSNDASAREYADASTDYQHLMRSRIEFRHPRNHESWRHVPEITQLLDRVPPGDCPPQLGTRGRTTRYFSQAYARLHPRGLARTITTNFHNPGSGRFTHYAEPRTLTIREALRVQGFRDEFHFSGDVFRSHAERLVGNAFPRLLATTLADHVRRELQAG